MIRLAFHNLFQNKIRLVISVGGVALALLLILSLDAIFAGVEQQITAYIDNSSADIFVSQSGVQNMHMAASSLPAIDIDEVKGVSGVQAVTPIHYTTNMIVIGTDRNLAYIIGLPENSEMGGPWEISAGSGQPKPGEAVIDRSVAEKSGVRVGNNVEILGRKFKVIGLSEGTASLINSVAFISMVDFAAERGGPVTVSYLLVKVKPGESPKDVVERIKTRLGDVTVQLTSDFAAQERRVVKDMSTDVINIMNLIGFFIGLAVMALTVYTATLARRAEYGVLKALGARNGHLYQAVLAQALFSVAIGFGVGVVFTWLLSALIPRLGLNLTLIINGASLLKVGVVSLVIASFSALLPIRQIAGLDPAMVFRGK
ncbi:MAG: ABC transporter permease [Kiritimatiellota bacterium]|nr:ABC transporter permease [Kiritimatiellota bacterium]